jgi:hypothetical protein
MHDEYKAGVDSLTEDVCSWQDSLETYLRSRMSGVEEILQVLRKPTAAAVEELGTVPGLSSRVASEIKDSWDINKYRSEPSFDF